MADNPQADDLIGRTALVTGATSGIGRATVVALARRGARVLVASRQSPERTRDVLDEIAAAGGPGRAEHLPLDLADLESVRACAATVLARGEPLHLLVNNAGVAGRGPRTAQGFERTFGINHLGHFLLTTLLVERLRASAPARVVTVSSKAHRGARGLDVERLRRPTRRPAGLVEYQVSKLCNVLFTQELARRHTADGITAYAVHPGVVASNIWRPVPWPLRPLVTRFMASTASGADRVLHCATHPDVARWSGRYFEDDRPVDPNPVATAELAAELWSLSETWCA